MHRVTPVTPRNRFNHKALTACARRSRLSQRVRIQRALHSFAVITEGPG